MSGGINTLKERLVTVSRSIFRREKIFVFERTIAEGCFKTEAKVKVDIRLIPREDFPKIAKRFENFEDKVKERFDRGHICIGAVLNEDFVHLKWFAFNEAYSGNLERKLRLSSDSTWVYSSYTVPEYRGLGIAPKAMEKAFNHLSKRGIKKVYACVRHNNFSSLGAVHKEGFRKIGAITYTKLFKLRRYQCKGETDEAYIKLKWMFFL